MRRVYRRVVRDITKHIRRRRALRIGLAYYPPNYVFFPPIEPGAVVVDAGCGYQAEFSLLMIKHYGARVFAIDPTIKHRAQLNRLVDGNNGRLTLIPCALGARDAEMTFHESVENESGSLLRSHINVMRGETVTYDVRVMSLPTLMKEMGVTSIEILKLDLEGSEYELLNDIARSPLLHVRQIFVEFHHHAVGGYTMSDTRKIVERMSSCGYEAFTLDDHNYLFVARPEQQVD